MVEFVLMLAMVGVLWLIVCVFIGALGVMATHMRGNPDAAKAIIEHVFMPLFGEKKKEPKRKSPPGTAMVERKAPAEESSEDN